MSLHRRLAGRTALVCGASRGLGYACAQALHDAGASVMICARDPDRLAAAARSLGGQEAKVAHHPADLTRPADIAGLFAAAESALGGVDILVVNVGHPKMGGFDSLDESDWVGGFEGVFMPSVRLIRAAVPGMRRRGWGRIVNISSAAIREPGSTYVVSAVFRTALASLCKTLSDELGRSGIRVNTVCPGLIRTPLGQSILAGSAERSGRTPAEVEADYAARTAVGRIGEPHHVGELVGFLCSPAADHITGQVIDVDGGKGRSLF